jgi:hypothetical protein
MTPLSAVWITSTIGAVLFFLGGFFVARTRFAGAAPDVPALPPPIIPPAEDDKQAARELERVTSELEQVREERDQLLERAADAGDDLQARTSELQEQLQKANDERDRALQQVAISGHDVQSENIALQASVEVMEKELEQLKEERDTYKDEAKQNKTELEIVREKLRKQTRRAVDRLQSEQSTLQQRRAKLEAVSADLDRSRGELLAVRSQLEQSEKSRKKAEKDATHLREQVLKLEQEIHEASRKPGRTTIDATPMTPPPTAPSEEQLSQLRDASLESLIEQLAKGDETRSAVLADSEGLAIVGSGVHAEELAAAAAMLANTGQQASELLPMADRIRVDLLDRDQLAASVHPFTTGQGRLLLATLATSPGPDDRLIYEAQKRASSLLE